ncbi:pyruvate, water dikinase regulatory protein [Ahrensia sp. R2A130]|uniref:pyruvate, water dikinase regulatory protein n=1 Tax=Ahrensia sp. R2A130 TaxID=744979 RepID=UPI0001E0AC96|nr:pyruvate, water dikinase regulatory protein [Ahrensia sp. R2A130]EFL89703.1 putative phosphotransferase [Ahrensia sp. R2A130]
MALRNWIPGRSKRVEPKAFFHLHLISDSTGETLTTAARAAAAQYPNWQAVEHVTPLVRNEEQLDEALAGLDDQPGLVLYTMIDEALETRLVERCKSLAVPALNLLAPVIGMFDAFLGDTRTGTSGAQHVLDETYFSRLDGIRYAMAHDDGNLPDDLDSADVILIGISRTSKTPTSIYLGQRGVRCVNIPMVPGMELPEQITRLKKAKVVALVASVERILQVRENRLRAYDRDTEGDIYVDRASIQEELAWTRRLCQSNGWPMIDVSRRSVEETSAAILSLLSANK